VNINGQSAAAHNPGTAATQDGPVAAQPAHAADRFAHEILAILEHDTLRSRLLMRNPLGGFDLIHSGAENDNYSAIAAIGCNRYCTSDHVCF